MSEKIDEGTLRAKLLSGARWSIVIRGATQLYSWVVTLLMVRLLTPADYGLNSMIEASVELLALVGTMGVDTALVRFGRKDRDQLASAFGYLLAINGAIFIGLMLAAPYIAAYFGEPILESLIRVSAIAFLLSPFRTIPNALLDMNLDFKLKAQVELQATLVSSLAGLACAYAGLGVWALVIVVLSNAVLRTALLAWLRPWFIRPTMSIAQARPLLLYGMTVLLGSLITVATAKVYSIVAGPVIGAQVLGIFAVAASFSYMPISKTMPIVQQTLLPAFSKLADDPVQVKNYVLNAVELCTLVIVPLGVGMASVSSDLVTTFFGTRWESAALPLALLSLLTPLRVPNLIFNSALNATGRARLVVRLMSLSFVLILVGAWIGRDHGVMGLVYVSLNTSVIASLIGLAMARQQFGITVMDLSRAMGLPLLACATMAGAVALVNTQTRMLAPPLALSCAIATGAIAYICTLLGVMGPRLRQIRHRVMGR